MLINRNDIVDLIDQGSRAMESGQKRQASLAYYQAGKQLLQLAKNKRGVQRRLHNHQAKRLLDYGQKLEREAMLSQSDNTAANQSPVDTKINDANEFVPLSHPSTRFTDVIGLDELIDTLKVQTLETWKHPEMAKMYGQNTGHSLLFYGPPGTGKTLLVKALAGELDIPLYSINMSDILSKWIGESEQNVATLFKEARKHPKAIVFVDEIDALTAKREGDSHESSKRLVSQFLTELDGLNDDDNQSLLFIGACNHPWQIDDAIMRRLNPYYIPLPDQNARKQLFDLHLKDIPRQADLNLKEMAQRTQGYSGSDIARLIETAGSYAFREAIKTGQAHLMDRTDFEKALKTVKRSVTDELLAEYDSYEQKLHSKG